MRRARPTLLAVFCLLGTVGFVTAVRAADRPNVILVITDDQGYGDVGAHGNKMIQTPHLDRLFAQSARLTNFHVDPTCSPSRSALMSGRYSTRTGVWHTIMGRSIMRTEELTLAEVLQQAGYATGMFGKWHLGDNYPCRPQDQGFDLAFYHGGGGVGQTPDYYPNNYFDDTYFRNGKPEKKKGYCTDIWFDEALKFIQSSKESGKPFFAYLSTNAPHGPYLVAEKYSKPYRDRGVTGSMAPFYGMITNIDENMGRLMAKLDEWQLAEDTILIFMTDNGTAAGISRGRRGRGKGKGKGDPNAWRGFNAGMRGQKGSEYDGGHRVPFFIRWPGGSIGDNKAIDQLTAHVDVLPTVAELCDVESPSGPARDGMSIAKYLPMEASVKGWPERTLFVHSQRIENPQKGRKNSVMTQRWRLVNNKELYDIQADPGQSKNLADQHPAVVKRLNAAYDQWWDSLKPGFDQYVRLTLGHEAENPANLTCHDWHTNNRGVPWNHGHIRSGLMSNGYWAVKVAETGDYRITLRRWPKHVGQAIEAVKARIEIGGVTAEQSVDPEDTSAAFDVHLKAGDAKLQTDLTKPDGKIRGAYFVEVERVK